MTMFCEVRRELHEVGEDPDEPERDRDRRGREHERQQERERAEDVDQDQHRDRDRDEELADQEVVVLDRLEVVLDRATGRSRRSRAPAIGPAASRIASGVALRVGGLQLRDDGRGHDLGRDGAGAGDLARRQSSAAARSAAARTFGRFDGAEPAGALDDDRERALGLLAEVLARGCRRPSRSPPREARNGS